MSSYDSFFDEFCKKVILLDGAIRFSGISNHLGQLVSTSYREVLVPLMTREETERYAIQAAIRAATRETFEAKIGELQYSVSRYARLVRATIPIKVAKKTKFLLLLSFDIDAEADSIISKKVWPAILDNKEYFI